MGLAGASGLKLPHQVYLSVPAAITVQTAGELAFESGSVAVSISEPSAWARRQSFESNYLLSHCALRRREARDLHRVTIDAWKIACARRDSKAQASEDEEMEVRDGLSM